MKRMMKFPDPGTDDGMAWGCTCPRDQKAYGADPSRRAFAVMPNCPVHVKLAAVSKAAYEATRGSQDEKMRAAGRAVAAYVKTLGGTTMKMSVHAPNCYCPDCHSPTKA